jgi:Tol biopolymer transport system component
MQQGALLAQSFDFTQHQVSDTPVRIADQVRTIIGTLHGQFSLSNNGVLIFSEGRENQRLVLVDREGQKLQTLGSPGLYSYPRFSPDGQRVAVGRVDPQNQFQDIHLLDLAGGRDIRFTVEPGEDGYPLWSPDGSRIAWAARRGGVRELFWKATNGAGEEELLWKSPHYKFPSDWSKDGRFIAYAETAQGAGHDLWILPLTGERKAWPWLKTRFTESSARFSPDGKWIAYQSNGPGRNEVFVRAFNPDAPDTGGQWQISTNGGERPSWRNDGRELYYLAPDEKLMAVEVTLGAEVKAGTPRALFDLRELRAVTANVSYAATGDGQRFLFVTSAEDATLTPFTVVTNWMAEVKK